MLVEGKNPKKLFAEFEESLDSSWIFGNDVLYRMCENNLKHVDKGVVIGKVWLIGRSYAASIERGRKGGESNERFYQDVVIPEMSRISSELDERIEQLRMSNKSITEELDLILSTHAVLTDTFFEISGLHDRSLASKYLHFHCPDKFYIYDSRAEVTVTRFVHKPLDKRIIFGSLEKYDLKYAEFVCRMIELHSELDDCESTRILDSFLLWVYDRFKNGK